jgi:hypothetical protein
MEHSPHRVGCPVEFRGIRMALRGYIPFMASASELRDAGGFLVESSKGDVGWVEEVWLDEDDEPQALALQTLDGRHALLRAEDVLAVEPEERWVVVRPEQDFLELDAPRVRTSNGAMLASWGTTGALLRPPSEPRWHIPRHVRHNGPREHPRLAAASRRVQRWPAWLAIGALYGALALIVALLIAVAFLIAHLVTGQAY